ncbi:RNA helicase [Peptococcaceae bacterium SCADC1_2_3]|jgi:superfamily II RNA helicase|nr:RNA helicase [Peptococcaceae bacterium SCADC1_2_3]KFI35284.1 RNA helicase [Peptococcaceae bacterium SCADC1_2_3]KFI38068.1 RNA helicase [Peptococcaceae bacterium SCADC1_2_3]HBQ28900.1 RNA helicase [Desulfotomaculum sp.]
MSKVLANLEPQISCTEVIEVIQEHLPSLYFTFGRRRTEVLAEELSRQWDFLNMEEKQKTRQFIRQAEEKNPGLFNLRRENLRRFLYQGIGYHHAGLSPALKDLVERLYESRLTYVLFCTETFAVGVNFPAASTIFDSCRKWDGQVFRNLHNREFFQMAGRSGRRGYDEVGRVFVCLDQRFPEQMAFYEEDKIEPVQGRLTVTPNTVLNLLHWKNEAEIKTFLEQNLAAYQNNKEMSHIKQEILKSEAELARQEEVFCAVRRTPACQLQRLKLRQELNYLSRRKNRHSLMARERKKEIYSLLKNERQKCNDKICCRTEKRIKKITEKINFFNRQANYLSKNSREYEQEFTQVLELLRRLGFVKGRELLPRGLFALNIHVQEILVTELIFSGLFLEVSSAEAAAILAGVDYQPGREERAVKGSIPLKQITAIKNYLLRHGVPEHFCLWSPLPGPLAYAWYEGASFATLLNLSKLQEGDIFSLLRREIDLLRQIERAAGNDPVVTQFAQNLRYKLDRDEVAITGF